MSITNIQYLANSTLSFEYNERRYEFYDVPTDLASKMIHSKDKMYVWEYELRGRYESCLREAQPAQPALPNNVHDMSARKYDSLRGRSRFEYYQSLKFFERQEIYNRLKKKDAQKERNKKNSSTLRSYRMKPTK